jgi:hypothetical protein
VEVGLVFFICCHGAIQYNTIPHNINYIDFEHWNKKYFRQIINFKVGSSAAAGDLIRMATETNEWAFSPPPPLSPHRAVWRVKLDQ